MLQYFVSTDRINIFYRSLHDTDAEKTLMVAVISATRWQRASERVSRTLLLLLVDTFNTVYGTDVVLEGDAAEFNMPTLSYRPRSAHWKLFKSRGEKAMLNLDVWHFLGSFLASKWELKKYNLYLYRRGIVKTHLFLCCRRTNRHLLSKLSQKEAKSCFLNINFFWKHVSNKC